MRPSPDILHRWVDPADPHADSLEVTTGHEDALYGICRVTAAGEVTPVNLRTSNPQTGQNRYARTAQRIPGHSVGFSDRMNERFRFVPRQTSEWFASYKFEPTSPTPYNPARRGGTGSAGRRVTNRVQRR